MAVISLPSWRNTICSPAWLIGVVWQKNPPQACNGMDAVVIIEANSTVAVAAISRIKLISLSGISDMGSHTYIHTSVELLKHAE